MVYWIKDTEGKYHKGDASLNATIKMAMQIVKKSGKTAVPGAVDVYTSRDSKRSIGHVMIYGGEWLWSVYKPVISYTSDGRVLEKRVFDINPDGSIVMDKKFSSKPKFKYGFRREYPDSGWTFSTTNKGIIDAAIKETNRRISSEPRVFSVRVYTFTKVESINRVMNNREVVLIEPAGKRIEIGQMVRFKGNPTFLWKAAESGKSCILSEKGTVLKKLTDKQAKDIWPY